MGCRPGHKIYIRLVGKTIMINMARDNISTDKRRIQDAEGSSMDFDEATGALINISPIGHALHEGKAFCAHHSDVDLDNTDTLVIAFTTPDTPTWIHMSPRASNSVASVFDILEGPTLTVDSGSEDDITNRNRNSTITSELLSIETTVQADMVTLDPTITGNGTTLHAEVMGGYKNYPGSALGPDGEYVLRQDTTYAFRLTGSADNGVASIELFWHEHVNLA